METSPIMVKASATVAFLVDIIVTLVKFIYYIAEALYLTVFPPPKKSVRGQVVLITGAGHGIGRELALQLSELGARLALWDLNLTLCEQTAKEVRAIGGEAFAFKCDVSNREEVFKVAEETRKAMVNPVSILFNNAGIMACKSFLETSENDIRKQFDVNVLAHFWMLEAFLPALKESGNGHVVALSSMAGILGLVNLVPYCASKFAVRGLMEALSEEIRMDPTKPDIKFTTIYPFIVNTGLVKKPRIKYPSLLGVVSAKDAATSIIDAMRRDVRELSIPSTLFYLNNICRNLPFKVAFAIRDLLDSGCEAHDS